MAMTILLLLVEDALNALDYYGTTNKLNSDLDYENVFDAPKLTMCQQLCLYFLEFDLHQISLPCQNLKF